MMKTPRRTIFLPLPPLSAEQAADLIDVLESAVAELWGVYGDDIRELHAFMDEDDIPDVEAPPLGDGDPL